MVCKRTDQAARGAVTPKESAWSTKRRVPIGGGDDLEHPGFVPGGGLGGICHPTVWLPDWEGNGRLGGIGAVVRHDRNRGREFGVIIRLEN